MPFIRRIVASFAVGATASLLVACDDMGGRRMTGTKPAATQPAAGNSRPASALGKAKGSAERVQDRVDDHNRNIEKAAEEIGKD